MTQVSTIPVTLSSSPRHFRGDKIAFLSNTFVFLERIESQD